MTGAKVFVDPFDKSTILRALISLWGPAMLTIFQKIQQAREVRVLLDPDYAPDTPHAWTVKITKQEAKAIVSRAGKEARPKGLADADGILLLYPHNS